jgi:hypothetical protein
MPRLASVLAAALLLTPVLGCGLTHSDLEIDWVFGSGTCADYGVAQIRVSIAGEQLSPDTFACTQGGQVTTGADLGRFLTGLYDVTVDALDSSGNVLSSSYGTIEVVDAPHNVFTFDLGTGTLKLSWTFDGSSCAASGANWVRAWLDGQLLTSDTGSTVIPCNGSSGDGVTISPIEPGSHTLDLEAVQSPRQAPAQWSLYSLPFTVGAVETVQLYPDLLSVASGSTASIEWTFAGLTCSEAQVDSVVLTVDGTVLSAAACDVGGAEGAIVTSLAPGKHTFTTVGLRAGQALYQSATVSATLLSGIATYLPIDAAAQSPARGGATLSWKFPSGGPDCTSTTGAGTSITYTLTDPSGNTLAARTATCGGAAGSTGVIFCNPAAGGCTGSDTGLSAGYWGISAVSSGAPAYAASSWFAVPNAASASWDVPFTLR